MDDELLIDESERLPESYRSLAWGVGQAVPGGLVARAVSGGITIGPREGRTIVFGRNRPEVHVCVGEDDRRVSRQQGVLNRRRGQWWIGNTGRLPIRLPGSRWLFREEGEIPLAEGYTPLFLRGSGRRVHVMELFVVGTEVAWPSSLHDEVTEPPRTYRLSAEERLALVVLGQRYLLYEADPRPLSRQQAADQLTEVRPGAGWTAKRVERVVAGVRARLSANGVYGLVREEIGEPVGNSLNHNLFTELIQSTTLVPQDLVLLDAADGPSGPPAGKPPSALD